VRIVRHGQETFGWEIRREADLVEVQRSERLFASHVEALLDSAHAAAILDPCRLEASSVDGEGIDGRR